MGILVDFDQRRLQRLLPELELELVELGNVV